VPFRTVDQIAHRPHLAVALVAALAVLLCSAGALWRPPAPAVHDEFSYLLAADTFSSGRLFNPTHPMWKHFETIHVIWQPVYASKYLPAQGLLLALGQTLTGHAIVGSWIGVAAACAAILWMLQGWLPPRWALFGGMLTATHPYIVGAWGHGYWGGALTAAAGALVYGALPRLAGPRRRQNAVAFAIGLVLLAWTRPFEGFLIGTPACLWLAWQYRPGQPGSSQSKPRKAAELAIPIATICVAGAAMLLFYNFRLTGDALKFPYMIHEETYAEIPPLLWQDLRPPVQHRHQVLDDFWSGWAAQAYRVAQTPGGFITTLWLKATHLASHYTASPLAFLLLLVPMALWRRRRRLALIAIATGFLLVGIAQISWIYTANYIAPGLCLLVLLMVQAARYLRGWRRHGPLSGRMLLRIIVLTHLAACIAAWPGFLDTPVWAQQRERIARRLDAQPGRNLILVQYGGADVHDPHAEWVYNEADIDRAKTIWARTMGATRDAELLNYYRDRTFWLLHADEHPIRLEKIDRSATSR
jgi:hypothetical protein